MNVVFPLMPWKNYTKKDKIRIFLFVFVVFFFYIFTKNKSPPNLATREVEQPLMVEREGASCPASSSFKVPSHGQQESTALVAGANVGLATRGLGLEAPQFIRSLVSR